MKVVVLHPLGYEHHGPPEPSFFAAIANELRDRRHVILNPSQIGEADILLFDGNMVYENGTAKPYDPLVLEAAVARHIPVVWFDDLDHADPKAWPSDVWPLENSMWPGDNNWSVAAKLPFDKYPFAKFGCTISRPGANRMLYFMRMMQTGKDYPDYVLPLEYPILEEWPLVSKEELCSRPNDVCGMGNIGLQRAMAFTGLLNDRRLKADCEIIPHYRRMSQEQWTARHRNAKMAAHIDTSLATDRTLRLFSIAPILRGKSDHKLPFPMEDMKHMVVVGDYDGHMSKTDIDKILSVVTNPDLLFSIYTTGAEFIQTHYSLTARTKYVVDNIEKFV